MSNVTIHVYSPDFRVRRVVRECPRCDVRRVHCQQIYEWHDPDHTCLTCGCKWTHDWLYPTNKELRASRIKNARAWLKVKRLRYRGLRFDKNAGPVLR